MAAATATIAVDMPRALELQDHGAGKQKLTCIMGTVTIVGDYSTGGVSCDLSTYFRSLKRVIFSGNTFAAQYDYTNKAVKLYGDQASAALGTLDEPNGVTLSSTAFDFVAFGF